MMKVWLKYHSFPPEGEQAIRRETIWYNECITYKQQDARLQKRWEEAGIITIQDICHPQEGRLLSHQEITARYNMPCTFLDALSLRLGIPLQWRMDLTPNFEGNTDPAFQLRFSSGTTLPVTTTSAKRLYSELIPAKRGVIRTQRAWDATINVAGPEEWKEIYTRPFAAARETKIQSFQYRLNHRLITCNRLLFRYKIKDTEACTLCDQPDTMEHFFFQCPTTRKFWDLVFRWIKAASDLELGNISLKEILVGVPKEYPQSKKTNFLLLTSRYFIHRQRLFHGGNLCIIQWIRELRNRLLTERQVCFAEGRSHRFNMWHSTLAYT